VIATANGLHHSPERGGMSLPDRCWREVLRERHWISRRDERASRLIDVPHQSESQEPVDGLGVERLRRTLRETSDDGGHIQLPHGYG